MSANLYLKRYISLLYIIILSATIFSGISFAQTSNVFSTTPSGSSSSTTSVSTDNSVLKIFLDNTLAMNQVNDVWSVILRISFIIIFISVMVSSGKKVTFLNGRHAKIIAVIIGIIAGFALTPQSILSLYVLAILGILIAIIFYFIDLILAKVRGLIKGIVKAALLFILGVLFWQWSTTVAPFPVVWIQQLLGTSAGTVFKIIAFVCWGVAAWMLVMSSPLKGPIANSSFGKKLNLGGERMELSDLLDRGNNLKNFARTMTAGDADRVIADATNIINEAETIKTNVKKRKLEYV